MIDYSIIIPTHNSSSTLLRLLYSIPAKDYVETIIVDDYSELDEVTKTRNIIQEFHQRNQIYATNTGNPGAGSARNLGMSFASGKWIVFADSDDFFTENFDMALDQYRNTDYDLVQFLPTTEPNEKNISRTPYTDRMFNSENTDIIGYSVALVTSRFIKRSIILEHNLACSETMVENDRMFSITSFYYAQNRTLDKRSIYSLTVREGSLANHRHSINELETRARVRVSAAQFLQSHLDSSLVARVLPVQGTLLLQALFEHGPRGLWRVIRVFHGHHIPISHKTIWSIPSALSHFIGQRRQ